MSFKAVQKKIEGEGYGKNAAGAILASASRNASPAAKKANPNLKKVTGAPAPKARKHMEIEETDNGGYVSKTTHILPHKPGGEYRPNPVTTGQHGSLRSLNSHVRKTFAPKSAAPAAKPGGGSEWSSVASKMLGHGGY